MATLSDKLKRLTAPRPVDPNARLTDVAFDAPPPDLAAGLLAQPTASTEAVAPRPNAATTASVAAQDKPAEAPRMGGLRRVELVPDLPETAPATSRTPKKMPHKVVHGGDDLSRRARDLTRHLARDERPAAPPGTLARVEAEADRLDRRNVRAETRKGRKSSRGREAEPVASDVVSDLPPTETAPRAASPWMKLPKEPAAEKRPGPAKRAARRSVEPEESPPSGPAETAPPSASPAAEGRSPWTRVAGARKPDKLERIAQKAQPRSRPVESPAPEEAATSLPRPGGLRASASEPDPGAATDTRVRGRDARPQLIRGQLPGYGALALATAARRIGRTDDVILHLCDAIRLGLLRGDERAARRNVATLALERQQWPLAVEHLEALAAGPDFDPWPATQLVELHTKLGDRESAARWQQRASELASFLRR